jgi:putative ABC transport system permease protein
MPPPPNSNLGYTAHIQLTAPVLITSFVIGVTAAVLAAFFSARRVARLQIVDALRQNI